VEQELLLLLQDQLLLEQLLLLLLLQHGELLGAVAPHHGRGAGVGQLEPGQWCGCGVHAHKYLQRRRKGDARAPTQRDIAALDNPERE
jgi:hypothetical protein